LRQEQLSLSKQALIQAQTAVNYARHKCRQALTQIIAPGRSVKSAPAQGAVCWRTCAGCLSAARSVPPARRRRCEYRGQAAPTAAAAWTCTCWTTTRAGCPASTASATAAQSATSVPADAVSCCLATWRYSHGLESTAGCYLLLDMSQKQTS